MSVYVMHVHVALSYRSCVCVMMYTMGTGIMMWMVAIRIKYVRHGKYIMRHMQHGWPNGPTDGRTKPARQNLAGPTVGRLTEDGNVDRYDTVGQRIHNNRKECARVMCAGCLSG